MRKVLKLSCPLKDRLNELLRAEARRCATGTLSRCRRQRRGGCLVQPGVTRYSRCDAMYGALLLHWCAC